MKASNREFTGTLVGFDDFVSECGRMRGRDSDAAELTIVLRLPDMVLSDVTE